VPAQAGLETVFSMSFALVFLESRCPVFSSGLFVL
jgi:hypothetical protein